MTMSQTTVKKKKMREAVSDGGMAGGEMGDKNGDEMKWSEKKRKRR